LTEVRFQKRGGKKGRTQTFNVSGKGSHSTFSKKINQGKITLNCWGGQDRGPDKPLANLEKALSRKRPWAGRGGRPMRKQPG